MAFIMQGCLSQKAGRMKKRYLPTNDLLFKRCVGNARHPEITKGFINDLTGIQVSAIQLLTPMTLPGSIQLKTIGNSALLVLMFWSVCLITPKLLSRCR